MLRDTSHNRVKSNVIPGSPSPTRPDEEQRAKRESKMGTTASYTYGTAIGYKREPSFSTSDQYIALNLFYTTENRRSCFTLADPPLIYPAPELDDSLYASFAASVVKGHNLIYGNRLWVLQEHSQLTTLGVYIVRSMWAQLAPTVNDYTRRKYDEWFDSNSTPHDFPVKSTPLPASFWQGVNYRLRGYTYPAIPDHAR